MQVLMVEWIASSIFNSLIPQVAAQLHFKVSLPSTARSAFAAQLLGCWLAGLQSTLTLLHLEVELWHRRADRCVDKRSCRGQAKSYRQRAGRLRPGHSRNLHPFHQLDGGFIEGP